MIEEEKTALCEWQQRGPGSLTGMLTEITLLNSAFETLLKLIAF